MTITQDDPERNSPIRGERVERGNLPLRQIRTQQATLGDQRGDWEAQDRDDRTRQRDPVVGVEEFPSLASGSGL